MVLDLGVEVVPGVDSMQHVGSIQACSSRAGGVIWDGESQPQSKLPGCA